MDEVIYQADLDKLLNLLKNLLSQQAPDDAMAWLANKQTQIFEEKEEKSDHLYFMTFSAISSYFGKDLLKLTEEHLKQMNAIRKNWQPHDWSLSQTARTYLLLSFARSRLEHFKKTTDKLFGAADVNESIALYQALPLFPYPKQFLLHATNGIRSNMLSVFEAIALNNPYPADYFDEIAWNQVVLKTLFVESPIEKVVGLKQRANPLLAKALLNTARERLAADRPIKLELWCLLGLSADKEMLASLKECLKSENPLLKKGALLACHYCQLPEARDVLKNYVEDEKTIATDLQQLRPLEKSLT